MQHQIRTIIWSLQLYSIFLLIWYDRPMIPDNLFKLKLLRGGKCDLRWQQINKVYRSYGSVHRRICFIPTKPLRHKQTFEQLWVEILSKATIYFTMRKYILSHSVFWIQKCVILIKCTIQKLGRKNKVSFFVRIQVHKNDNPLEYDNKI